MLNDILDSERLSLLLDFDGTLVELAPDPMGIKVDPQLRGTLQRLMNLRHLSVAIVTGRQISVIDGFLGLPDITISGNHGTEIRRAGDAAITRLAPPLPEKLRAFLAALAARLGCLFEEKHETAVLHAPDVPQFEALRGELRRFVTEEFQEYKLWEIGLSVEIHNRHFNKISGIQDILDSRDFRSYPAVYIGDDAETYPGLGLLGTHGVSLLHVGNTPTAYFPSPARVRQFLDELASRYERAEDSFASIIELAFISHI